MKYKFASADRCFEAGRIGYVARHQPALCRQNSPSSILVSYECVHFMLLYQPVDDGCSDHTGRSGYENLHLRRYSCYLQSGVAKRLQMDCTSLRSFVVTSGQNSYIVINRYRK
jgi:hypothetical protein